ARLAALVIREEDEPALVVPLEQHHPYGRPSARARRREREGVRLRETARLRVGVPRRELAKRIGVQLVLVHPRRAYCGPPLRCRVVAVTKAIDIRTEIPGPRSRELLEREREAVASALVVHLPVFAADAEGVTITDVDGNRFIDFAGGVGVMNVGHGHPRVVEAVQEQAGRYVHTDFTVVPYEGYVQLAERLGELVPISGGTPAAFFKAGTETVANALK